MKPQEQEEWRKRFNFSFPGKACRKKLDIAEQNALGDFIAAEIERAKSERDEEIREWAQQEKAIRYLFSPSENCTDCIPEEKCEFCAATDGRKDGYGRALEALITFLSTPQEI